MSFSLGKLAINEPQPCSSKKKFTYAALKLFLAIFCCPNILCSIFVILFYSVKISLAAVVEMVAGGHETVDAIWNRISSPKRDLSTLTLDIFLF